MAKVTRKRVDHHALMPKAERRRRGRRRQATEIVSVMVATAALVTTITQLVVVINRPALSPSKDVNIRPPAAYSVADCHQPATGDQPIAEWTHRSTVVATREL